MRFHHTARYRSPRSSTQLALARLASAQRACFIRTGSADALHRLRVALRRSRSCPDLCSHTVRLFLRRTARATNHLRDLDTLIARIKAEAHAGNTASSTNLRPLLRAITARRNAECAAVTQLLSTPAHIRQWTAWIRSIIAHPEIPPPPQGSVPSTVASKPQGSVPSTVASKPQGSVPSTAGLSQKRAQLHAAARRVRRKPTNRAIHKLRISVKRLRYSLETLPTATPSDLHRLKQLQDLLGAHQDTVVHRRILKSLSATLASPSPEDQPIRHAIRTLRRDLKASKQALRRRILLATSKL